MEQEQSLGIGKYLGLIYKKRYLYAVTAILIMTASAAAGHLLPAVYEAKTVVSIEKNLLNDIIKNIVVTPSMEDKVRALSTVMLSRTLLLKVVADLDLDVGGRTEAEVEGLIKRLQEKTEVKIEFNKTNRRDMEFFTVSYRDHNPALARDYVNGLVRRYIEENLISKREQTYGANQFLLDQINLFKERMGKLEAEIAWLAKDRDLQVYDRLLELQKRLDDLLVQYTEGHPEVMRVRADIEALKSRLSPGRSAAPPVLSAKKRLGDLERERDTFKKIYEELVAAYGKSEVSIQVEVQDKAGTFRIMEPAILPIKPVSPDRVKIMLLGMLAALAGAFGLVFLLDATDQSVKSLDTLKGLGVTVLAVIPHIENRHETVRQIRKDVLLYGLSGLSVLGMVVLILQEKFNIFLILQEKLNIIR